MALATVTATDWLTRHGYHTAYATGPFYPYHHHYYGPYYGGYVDTYSPDYFLRLIFDPDGKLKTWKNFAK